MSLTSGPTVAIAGASGTLGKYIVQSFTSNQVRSKFSEIILLSRKADYVVPGTITRQISDDVQSITDALKDVTVVVNALGSPAYNTKEALIYAIEKSPNVQLYFPSEFGVDHRIPGPDGVSGTDPDFDHKEWRKKKTLHDLAQKTFAETGHQVKICNLYVSLFMEHSIGPWFGLSVKNKHFEAVGSADENVSWTSLEDIGKVLAALSLVPAKAIPENMRISGDTESIREVAAILDEVANDGKTIKVDEVDIEEKRKYAKENVDKVNPAAFIISLMGSGKLDFGNAGLGNGNEFVNPDQKFWKWKSIRDYAKEVGGRPYTEY